jgi:hypothetical protein
MYCLHHQDDKKRRATANVFPSSPLLITLMEPISCYETSVLTRATRHHIPEDGILHFGGLFPSCVAGCMCLPSLLLKHRVCRPSRWIRARCCVAEDTCSAVLHIWWNSAAGYIIAVPCFWTPFKCGSMLPDLGARVKQRKIYTTAAASTTQLLSRSTTAIACPSDLSCLLFHIDLPQRFLCPPTADI